MNQKTTESIYDSEHVERHFKSSELVRDIVIGMSDGLTVPFALAAGLSGTVSTTGYVVIAGLAEIAAGSIAMGLGGILAARTDSEHSILEARFSWSYQWTFQISTFAAVSICQGALLSYSSIHSA